MEDLAIWGFIALFSLPCIVELFKDLVRDLRGKAGNTGGNIRKKRRRRRLVWFEDP